MSKTLKTILAGTAMLALGACAANQQSAYDLPRFQQIVSTAESCKEIEELEIKMTFHDVIIDEGIDKYNQNGMNPIVIYGGIPTTNIMYRRTANLIEQGRDDESSREFADKILKIGERQGNEYPDREDRLNRLMEGGKRGIVAEFRHDDIVLYISPEIYTKNVAQYVQDSALVGKFTINGIVDCLTRDEYKKAREREDSNIPEIGVGDNSDTFMTRYFETHSFRDLRDAALGSRTMDISHNNASEPKFFLHLRLTGIDKIGEYKGYWNSGP